MKYLSVFFLFFTLAACGQKPEHLSADDFEKKLATTPNAQVLDVRTKGEFSDNHLKNALNANFNDPTEFNERTKYLDKNKPVFVYCLAGGRSAKAAEMLASQGYIVYDLKGGMNAWRNANKLYDKGSNKKAPGIAVADFEKMVAGEKLALVDYGAKWCPPCKKLAPVLEEINKEYSGKLKVIQIDIDENETLAQAKKVEALPVLVLYKNGKIVWKQEGFAEKAVIEAEIKKNL